MTRIHNHRGSLLAVAGLVSILAACTSTETPTSRCSTCSEPLNQAGWSAKSDAGGADRQIGKGGAQSNAPGDPGSSSPAVGGSIAAGGVSAQASGGSPLSLAAGGASSTAAGGRAASLSRGPTSGAGSLLEFGGASPAQGGAPSSNAPLALGGTQASGQANGGNRSSSGGSSAAAGGSLAQAGRQGFGGTSGSRASGATGAVGGAGTGSWPPSCTTVTGTTAKVLVADGALLLDVREPSEFAADALPGAVNFPLASIAPRLGELDAARPIVVYCASGSRAANAMTTLCSAGYVVYNLGARSNWPK